MKSFRDFVHYHWKDVVILCLSISLGIRILRDFLDTL
jgi:hypothetical protein